MRQELHGSENHIFYRQDTPVRKIFDFCLAMLRNLYIFVRNLYILARICTFWSGEMGPGEEIF